MEAIIDMCNEDEDVVHDNVDTDNIQKEKNSLQKQLSDATDHTFDMNMSDRSLDTSLKLVDAADDDAVDKIAAVTNDNDTTRRPSSKFNKKDILLLLSSRSLLEFL